MLRIERIATMPQEKRVQMLEEFPSRLAEDGQFEHLRTFLTSCDFLQMKMNAIGLEPLIDDYALAKRFEGNAEGFTLQRIADALRASIVLLRQAPEEIWNQVKGRADFALHANYPRPVPRLDLRFATLLPADEALFHLFQGHSARVTSCALSEDGSRALSASDDKTLRVWDTASGECLYTLKGHSKEVRGCSLSADGHLAFSISTDSRVILWDTRSGQPLHIFKMNRGFAFCCALSPDGKQVLLSVSDGTLRLMDAASGRFLSTVKVPTNLVLQVLSEPQVKSCALSANGQRALTGSENGTVRVWDTARWQLLCSLKGHTHSVTSCALSDDGRLALSASDDKMLRVWNTITGKCLSTLKGHTGAVEGCALSADGLLALSASQDGTLRLWNATSGQLLSTLAGHTVSATCCALSKDGRLALSGYEDGTLRVWKIASVQTSGTQESRAGHTGWVISCALSRDGSVALSSSRDGTIRLWDTTGERVRSTTLEGHRSAVLGCALSANGTHALSASADRTLRFWDTKNGKTLHILKRVPDKVPGVSTLIGMTKGLAALIDRLKGKKDDRDDAWSWVGLLSEPFPTTWTLQSLRTLISFRGFMLSCALSADGRLALSTSSDGKLQLWNTESGRALRTKKYRWAIVNGCSLSADGRFALTASRDDRRLWLWYTTKPWRAFIRSQSIGKHWRTGHTQDLTGCALSADGRLALSAARDGTLQFWNTRGQLLHVLKGHRGAIHSCALSSDGCFALSVADDQTLRLWNTANGQEIARWTHDIPLWCCALSIDGRLATAGDIQGGVHFLNVVGIVEADDASITEPPVS